MYLKLLMIEDLKGDLTVHYSEHENPAETTNFFPLDPDTGECDFNVVMKKPIKTVLYHADKEGQGLFLGTFEEMKEFDSREFGWIKFNYVRDATVGK